MGKNKKSNASGNEANEVKHSKKKSFGKRNLNSAQTGSKKEVSSSRNWIIIAFILACVVGWLHGVHVSTMFEKDRHFSHLSSLERDLTFRTEMGLYYSYYKSVITADSLFDGIYQIVYDNITEYPSTINVLKRFNLYPELIVGSAYRIFDSFTKANKISTKECWQIKRGGDLPPVESCEGIGDQHYFYISNIFLLNGLMMSFVFLYCWYITQESILGGIIGVSFYFFNHSEATRVMWTPPLRESFSFPFLIIEMAMVSWTVKTEKPTLKHGVLVALSAFCFTLPWQFAQFALLTQLTALFILYMLEFIGSYKMKLFIYAHIASLLSNFVFQFGNEMLLTSFFASSLIVMLVIVFLEDSIESKVNNLILRCVAKGSIWLVGTFVLKKAISAVLSITDDAHIFDILKSKFTDYANFHTMLYTCAKEFDFIEGSTLWGLTKTLLIPTAFVVCVFVAINLLKFEYNQYSKAKSEKTESPEKDEAAETPDKAHRSKPNADVFYNVLQMFAFTIIAVLIMRLKLFMTPMLCIVSSLIAHRQLMPFSDSRGKQVGFIVVILGMACVPGMQNLAHQFNIMGEFENWPHEQLLDFINQKLPKTAVFAGAMPTMASIKLSCERAIVNHPHYEDAGLRERTHRVYMMYSRKPLNEVHQVVRDMKVTHYVLEDSWCTRKTKDGCLMAEIYDLEDEKNRGRTPACTTARQNPEPYFTVVFRNDIYTVLQVNKLNTKNQKI